MNKKYDVRFWQDDQWAVYDKDNLEGPYLFKGNLQEVNAWFGLKEKGFDI